MTDLTPYLPEGFHELCTAWVVDSGVVVRIVAPRRLKMGDFRPAYGNKPDRITINADLDPLSFMVTLAHEVAHLLTWRQYGQQVRPHGPEWKSAYRRLLLSIIEQRALPPQAERALLEHSKKTKACFPKELLCVARQLQPDLKSAVAVAVVA